MGIKISVIATLYYSEKHLLEFCARIQRTLRSITEEYEIIFVNDGSPDRSDITVLTLQQEDSRIVLIDLSRNFGHHQAIMTGLGQAKGGYIFLIDVDLEEAPELLLEFWAKIISDEKFDVIYGVQEKRKGGFFEKISGNVFYKILNSITHFKYPSNTLTARLMKKKYVDSVLQFREKAIDIWAIFILVGFNQVGVHAIKKNKGSSTYTLIKKMAMSIEIITSFSHRPLYLIFVVGVIWLLLSTLNVFFVLINKWCYGTPVEGWASILASVWLIGGITIFFIGIVSVYLSKMFLEIKSRPLSIIKNIFRKE